MEKIDEDLHLFVCSDCDCRVWPFEYGPHFVDDAEDSVRNGDGTILCGECLTGCLEVTHASNCIAVEYAFSTAIQRVRDGERFTN